jgi:hypothetical protein
MDNKIYEEYWFKTTTHNGIHEDCIEYCHVKNDGTMIGSAKCQQCEFCKGCGGKFMDSFTGPDWIKCSKLSDARGVILKNPKLSKI